VDTFLEAFYGEY